MLAALSLIVSGLVPTQQDSPEAPPSVSVQLLADTTRAVPGEAFQLAVLFRIPKEHWHIYWENPGDSGLATDVVIRGLPDGWTAGTVEFPAPRKYELPGDLVSYAYEGEVALFVTVTPPERTAAEGPLELTAAARWLVCKEACFLGNAEASLRLPVGGEAAPANEEVLAPHRARLPRPWKELRGAAVAPAGSPERPALEVSVPGADELEFFPLYSDEVELVSAAVLRTGAASRIDLAFEISPDAEGAPRARGVLGVRRGEERRFYRLDLALDRPR